MTVSWGFTSMNLSIKGWASHKGSGHLDVVMSDGSGGLEDELELALGGVGVVIEYLSDSLLASLLHGQFYGFDATEGILNQLGIMFF